MREDLKKRQRMESAIWMKSAREEEQKFQRIRMRKEWE